MDSNYKIKGENAEEYKDGINQTDLLKCLVLRLSDTHFKLFDQLFWIDIKSPQNSELIAFIVISGMGIKLNTDFNGDSTVKKTFHSTIAEALNECLPLEEVERNSVNP